MSAARRALISVSDKTGLEPLARELAQLGFEILSTGGTSRFLQQAGIPVIDVSDYTGFPEIMDGRVKTLHPRVHGALLGRPDVPAHAAAMKEHGIIPFELVIVNLYPFEQTIARPGVSADEAIEQIDIGGPSMLRSAAKNHAHVGVVTSPEQYPSVLRELRELGRLSDTFRQQLAGAAFTLTARYDQAISGYFTGRDPAAPERFPARLHISLDKRSDLRYGENPHQSAAFYVESSPPSVSLAAAEQLHGKELSYNNLLDLDAALQLACEFDDPAAAVIKHTNPCGCAVASTLAEAFGRAWEGDPVSAFGSILAFNRPLDSGTATRLVEPGRFIEAIIAPGYEDAALEMLRTIPKWKNNVRLLACPAMQGQRPRGDDYRRVTGGLLVQDRDEGPEPQADYRVVTSRQPDEAEWRDLRFAWNVCKHVKSNAIVLVREGMLLGAGAGQMSRLDSSFLAAHKAGERSRGAVLASDAFFPFRDGIDEAARAGVVAVIQPGGSRNDEEVIEACNQYQIAMVLTGRRHFRH